MPRRSNNVPILIDEYMLTDITESPKDPVKIVKDHLKNNYWELLNKSGQKVECSICMEEVDCKMCFALLSCGHSFHLCCVIKCKSCPVCRS